MNPFPDVAPPPGLNVKVQLTTGAELTARFEAGQWWVGLADQEADAPLSNEHVVSWAYDGG